ncbi:MAG: ABC transporter permease [Anaerolineales bacterium]|nr:ABC transporter permease [Anaerolineales bacterium]
MQTNTAEGRKSLPQWRRDWKVFQSSPLAMFGLVMLCGLILVAVFAPALAAFPKGIGTIEEITNPPSAAHWFGTDDLGLDILAEVIWGTRITMFVGVIASTISMSIGVPIGLACAFYKGMVDTVLMGITDILLSLPTLALMILVAAVMGSSMLNVAIVIGFLSWPPIARVVRGVTLQTVEQPFTEAAISIGAKSGHIIRRHLLPNAVPFLVINILLVMSRAVLSEAGLSFLGLGDPTQWSLGKILQNAQRTGAFVTAWWQPLFPSLVIMLLVISITFVGTTLNEIANPKLKKR